MLRFWMLRTFDALICVVHFCLGPTVVYPKPRGVFSTVLLKSVAVCFYAARGAPAGKTSCVEFIAAAAVLAVEFRWSLERGRACSAVR